MKDVKSGFYKDEVGSHRRGRATEQSEYSPIGGRSGVEYTRTIDSGRLSHAYITSGSMADTLAMAAVCSGQGDRPCLSCRHCEKASRRTHPDITIIDKPPDKREIVVAQIRELKKDVIIVPNEADKKAYIVNDADTMNRSAQNAFLQILEEPPSHAVFILRTENAAALLPTVRSRCVELKTRLDVGSPGAEAAEMAQEFICALRSGNAGLTAFMFRLEKLEKELLAEFLVSARESVAAEFRASVHCAVAPGDVLARAEEVLIRAGDFLDLNVNAGHISGLICATLLKM